MTRARVLEGEVRAVGRGGDAVVETRRGIVLVPGALPGERVQIEPTSPQRGVARGRVVKILHSSPGRIEPACPKAARCGGCPLMIADEETQRDIKLGLLLDACRNLPGSETTQAQWVSSPDAFRYRRRARLAWHGRDWGYRAHRSRRVNDIDECIVLTAPLQAAWAAVRARLRGTLSGSGEVQLQADDSGTVTVALSTSADQDRAAFRACSELSETPWIAGVSLATGDGVVPATWGKPHVVVFSQANERVNELLVRAVVDLAAPEGLRVLELHSGVGNFTVELAARRPAALVAVEQDARAVRQCQAALSSRGLAARVTVGDASFPPKGRYDVVVLDPPREGARALFEHGELWRAPKRVVYVSCDTATLGRDLRLATARGYRIDRMIGFDMFPHTAHLESLVRLTRD